MYDFPLVYQFLLALSRLSSGTVKNTQKEKLSVSTGDILGRGDFDFMTCLAETGSQTAFSRKWAMPAKDTFDCPPIKSFVEKYLSLSSESMDPFSRNKRWAKHTNDLNPNTAADYHLDAEEFIYWMKGCLVVPDLVLFDPPYSPRQIKECYEDFGRVCDSKDTQNAALYSRVRKAIQAISTVGTVVLSFGWNSTGMGKDWETLEILLVCHGSAHNDTICMAQQRIPIEHQTEML